MISVLEGMRQRRRCNRWECNARRPSSFNDRWKVCGLQEVLKPRVFQVVRVGSLLHMDGASGLA